MRFKINDGVILPIAVLSLCGMLGCKDTSPAEETPASPSITAVSSSEAAAISGIRTKPGETRPALNASSPLTPDPKDVTKALGYIEAMRDRKVCNRVMGCRPSIALAGLGAATETAIVQALEKNKNSDGFWVLRCIDILGQIGRETSSKFLVGLLGDKRTEIRTRVAISLGRLADPSTKQAVESALDAASREPDLGFRIALLYALDRIGPFSVERRKEASQLLPEGRDGIGRISPVHLIVAAEVAKEWPIPEALPALRVMATHIGPFVRRHAIDALGRMKDTGAIPVLAGRLKDTVPSIRRAAMRALKDITGNVRPRSEADWLEWCEQRACRQAAEPTHPSPSKTGR